MRIKIAASPATSAADDRIQWTVDIYANDKIFNQGLALYDPLDKAGSSICRWYLEQYLQKEPYSTSKARKAASTLEGYGQHLADQLQLVDLAFDDEQKLEIEINDCSHSDSGPRCSVHQLFWELLEDESIWKPRAPSICVQRSIRMDSEHPSTIERILTSSYGSSSRERINILLVTARDLTRGSTLYGEISPSVASNILWSVKSRLDLAQAPVDLNIEVVRPGTFNALKRHLEHKRLHGQDSFQIIHFDVHGKVGTRKNAPATSKFSFLYFSDPDSYGIKPVASSQVAKLLREYRIPIVVLNACESARANAGDDANIAKTFARAGVKNVLAMMYKASESAMLRFLENFYKGLLIEGLSFTHAAASARHTLRSNSVREARFHLQLPIHDWFVPVVYSSVPELSFTQTYNVQQALVEEPSWTEETAEISLPGREFDLLRLEKELLQSGSLYLYGPPGVGKSSLLRYAEASWRCSSFVDVVVFLDFSTYRMSSFNQCLDEIVKQIGATEVGKEANIRASDDEENKYKKLMNLVANHHIAFILDGLTDLRVTQTGDVGIQAKMTLLASVLIPFLKNTLQPLNTEETNPRNETNLIVVSGRTRKRPVFLENDESSFYELKGLSITDAVDMVHKIMTIPAPLVVETTKPRDELAEIWKAEPLIHLLQCNPAALLQFSVLASSSTLSLREMYDILHSQNPIHRLDPSMFNHSTGLLGEFIDMIFTVSDESFSTLLMLAWYWHEGPSVSDFSEMLIASKIVSDDAAVCKALNEASRWGYIEFHPKGRISWIHPLFTIFTRILACSYFSRFRFSTGDLSHDFRTRFATLRMDHLMANSNEFLPWSAGPMHGLEYAVRLMITVLSSHVLRDSNENFWRYIILFFRTAERSSDRLTTMFLTRGIEFSERGEYCDRCKQNFLFTLKLCRGHGLLPLPHISWPMNAIELEGRFIHNCCNTEQTLIIAKYYEELLKGAIVFSKVFSGRNAVKTVDLGRLIGLAGALIEVHRRHIPMVESRTEEFIELIDGVIEESEQAFGMPSDPSLLTAKGMLSFEKALILLEDYKVEESKIEIKRALSWFYTSMNRSDAASQARVEEFLRDKSPEHAILWRSFLSGSKSGFQKLENTWEMMTKEALGYYDVEMSTLKKNDVRKAEHPLFELWDFFPQLQREHRIATSKFEFHEKDIDRGHWTRAMALHSGFVLKNVENLEFDQALDHITAQENLAEQHGVANEMQDKIQDAKQFVKIFKPFVSAMTSDETPSVEHFDSFRKEWTKLTGKHSIKHTEMDLVFNNFKESLIRDADSNLPHNSAPGILAGSADPSAMLKSSLQKHITKSMRSPDYRQMVLSAIANISTAQKKLENAEDASNEDEIFPCLTQLQLLSEDESHREFIKDGAVQERREWNTLRLIRDITLQLKAIADTDQIEERSKLLQRCRNIVSLSGDTTAQVKDVVDQLAISVEALHLGNLTKPAYAAADADDHMTAALLLKDILKLVKDGKFSQALAKNSISCDMLKTVRVAYYRSAVLVAFEDSRWADAVKEFSNWRSDEESWKILAASERHQATLELEGVCKVMFSLQEYFLALQNLDMLQAVVRLGDVRTAYEAKTVSEEILSQEMLNLCDRIFGGTFQRLVTGGPEAARAYYSECISILKEQGHAFLQ